MKNSVSTNINPKSRIKRKNIVFGLMLLVGLAGGVYETYQLRSMENTNLAIRQGALLQGDAYPYQKKFLEAYQHGQHMEFKHAIQSYSQLLESDPAISAPTIKEQSKIQYNIGNNLFLSGLKRLSSDGKMLEESKYDLAQAKLAYEQSLRLDPTSRLAKFNLSLLLSVLPQGMKNAVKEQSGMELSNLPIGLP